MASNRLGPVLLWLEPDDLLAVCLYFTLQMMMQASEMTYIVSSGALNSTHSLTQWLANLGR